jgi:hypothetical protein
MPFSKDSLGVQKQLNFQPIDYKQIVFNPKLPKDNLKMKPETKSKEEKKIESKRIASLSNYNQVSEKADLIS